MDDIVQSNFTANIGDQDTSNTGGSRVLDAHIQLRDDIISGILKPGEKLRLQHLKSEYGVSAATLREALSLLVSERLVISTAQRGFNVAPISLQDLRDISETRIMLEIQAAIDSVKAGDEDWEVQLIGAYHRLKNIEENAKDLDDEGRALWEQRNIEFHEALVAACPSNWTRQFRSMLHTHSERYRRLSLQTVGISRDVHEEHRQIFDAAMARDTKTLGKVLTQHIQKTFEVVYKMVKDDPSLT